MSANGNPTPITSSPKAMFVNVSPGIAVARNSSRLSADTANSVTAIAQRPPVVEPVVDGRPSPATLVPTSMPRINSGYSANGTMLTGRGCRRDGYQTT